jgi:tRNA(Ile)-lysidine synthase
VGRPELKRDPLDTRVLGFIRQCGLLAEGTRLVVGVSGGPDSLCLLSLLVGLRKELSVDLHVAHLDHQLRGSESRADAGFVERLCRQWDLPATVEGRDVRGYRTRRRISLEEAAREVRYAFLAEVAARTGAAAVAVGHTRDDNTETILMHLIRGSGTRGLRGLLPANRLRTHSGTVRVVRPLLEVSRVETVRFCGEHGLEARADATNRSLSLFRNRVRLELVPLLRKYNPRIDEALSRTAAMAVDEHEFLDTEAARAWDSVVERKQDTVVFVRNLFMSLPPALKRQLVRNAIGELLGDLKDIEARHVEKLVEAAAGPAGRTYHMPGGLRWVVEHDRYLLGSDAALLCPLPVLRGEFRLAIPGETAGSGWQVKAVVLPRLAGSPVSAAERRGERGLSLAAPPGTLTACLDLDRVGEEVVVRSVKSGDRFRPMGLGQQKKVNAFMLDARIPRSWRNRVPVVIAQGQVVWVTGWRIDETVKVTECTARVLVLEFRLAGDSS